MSPPLLKVCGLTRAADALLARDAGADLFGVIFVEGSPRQATEADARAIVDAVGAGCVVAVVRGEPVDAVRARCARLGLRHVQLHGGYTSADGVSLRAAGLRVLFAVPVSLDARGPLGAEVAQDAADWLVLDTSHAGRFGGAGRAFAWDAVERPARPFFVAGGVTPENLGRACALLRPDGVDLSSALESSPGRKSPARLDALRAAWRDAREFWNV